ncbi:hypothetical protein LRR81_07325 [Metabacillus sp. GX 13764]|uniref:hypothetical protein n=1 Tax=Metabacillus kandeliae TaxID=2900151 RepID=UPI001E3BB94C|nr:hypothetical protein [Metabacillus kandeliae]MCD7034045.1 hypothetical protein [Metabacillus kandeliae]
MNRQDQWITVTMNDKPKRWKAVQMAFHNRMKIIEALDEENEPAYLYFYLNKFLLAKQTKPKEGSRLSYAFQHGITVEAPHPLIASCLEENPSLSVKTVKQVFKQMTKQYTPQKTAYLLTYFDSFLSAEKITEIIKKFFLDFRRNGQFRHAYQMVMVLLAMDPKNKWGQDMANQMNFQKYKMLYEGAPQSYMEKDPLYAEMQLFEKRTDSISLAALEAYYKGKGRWMDQLALYIDRIRNDQSGSDFDSYIKLVSAHYSADEKALLLWDSYKKAVKDPRLLQELLQAFLHQGRDEDAINLLSEQPSLSPSQSLQLAELLEKDSLDYGQINLEQLQNCLIELQGAEHQEKILRTLIPALLKTWELSAVHEWLKPIAAAHSKLPVLKQFQSMIAMQDDPEQQLSLGKLYFEYHLYQQAIECFSWEMELRPDDPAPVQWLMKAYRDIGQIEESKSYMALYTTMQKSTLA